MNPYQLYNGLDDAFRPLGHPEDPPCPPPFPSRVRYFIYGCAMAAADHEARLAGHRRAQRMGRGR